MNNEQLNNALEDLFSLSAPRLKSITLKLTTGEELYLPVQFIATQQIDILAIDDGRLREYMKAAARLGIDAVAADGSMSREELKAIIEQSIRLQMIINDEEPNEREYQNAIESDAAQNAQADRAPIRRRRRRGERLRVPARRGR